VTDPSELAHDALIRVAVFIRTLPADQLTDLATGEAKLELVPKGGRRVAAPRSAGAALPRPARDIAATLAEIGDRAAAARYLIVDLKLTVPALKTLAGDLNITVSSKGTKAKLVGDIVEWAVGRRLDSDAINRVVTAR
jgi:hypothetical protein